MGAPERKSSTTRRRTASVRDAGLMRGQDLRASFIVYGRESSSSIARADASRGYLLSRSEEHTSELQSRLHLVCRLLLEKKKNTNHVQTVNCVSPILVMT